MKKIFVALDTNKLNKAKKIINLCRTPKLKIGFKIGLQLFFSKGGRKFVSEVAKKYSVFLDLKISDISNTSKSAINSLKDIRFNYITTHVNSGFKSLIAIKKETKKNNKNLKVLGVTVLTSLDQKSLREKITGFKTQKAFEEARDKRRIEKRIANIKKRKNAGKSFSAKNLAELEAKLK